MKHRMNLNNTPFNLIKNGTKTIELRLNDEKRQLLKENDFIEFTNRVTLEKIIVKIEDYINIRILKNYINILIKYQWDTIKMILQILKIWINIILKKNKKNMELLA